MHSAIAPRNLTDGQYQLHFRKGCNTLLFKRYNGIDLMSFSVVLSAPEMKTAPGGAGLTGWVGAT